MRRHLLLPAIALLATLAPPAFAKRPAPGTWDEGKLEFSWFGSEQPPAFVETDEAAYFWIKPGFDPAGRTIHFMPWEKATFLGEWGPDRDGDDHQVADQITAEMHNLLAAGWSELFPGAQLSTTDGDILALGRVVDCTTGSAWGKAFSPFAADGEVAFDFKLVDRASGQLLLALHHTVVSKLFASTTDSKLAKWIAKFVKETRKEGGLAGLYRDGDRADE